VDGLVLLPDVEEHEVLAALEPLLHLFGRCLAVDLALGAREEVPEVRHVNTLQ
jgi:hypothetical protein